jgi:hypothetical protein
MVKKMTDDYDYFQCDHCKRRLKVPVVLKDGKKVCKSHLDPNFKDFILDIKLNKFLYATENIEHTLNHIQSQCQTYRKITGYYSNLDENLNKKKRIYQKIHHMNLDKEFEYLNIEHSKYESIEKIKNENNLDLKEIDRFIYDIRVQLNSISVFKKVKQLKEDVAEKSKELNDKTEKLRSIHLNKPPLNIELRPNDKIENAIITCCCLDRLKPVIYLVIQICRYFFYYLLLNIIF